MLLILEASIVSPCSVGCLCNTWGASFEVLCALAVLGLLADAHRVFGFRASGLQGLRVSGLGFRV